MKEAGSFAPRAPTILVLGGSGQIGYELIRCLQPLGRVVAPSHTQLDLTAADAAADYVRQLRPAAIVNAAAYTAVDRAETEAGRCMAINAHAPGILANTARQIGSIFVHYSTDYVFDGQAQRPYVETDEPRPINVYGKSKLEGELAVAAAGGAWIVLRTSWVYGIHGANFMRTILRLARERTELRVVNDQIGAPTGSRSVAAATAVVLSTLLQDQAPAKFSGLYHLTAGGSASWYTFAKAILAGEPRAHEQICRSVLPITTSEYPTPARRPSNSRLNNAKIRSCFGIEMQGWEESLRLVLRDLAVQGTRC